MRCRETGPDECLGKSTGLNPHRNISNNMFPRVFAKYEQAIVAAGCGLTSFITVGWMVTDIQLQEKRKLIMDYEKKIKSLTGENKGLKELIEARGI